LAFVERRATATKPGNDVMEAAAESRSAEGRASVLQVSGFIPVCPPLALLPQLVVPAVRAFSIQVLRLRVGGFFRGIGILPMMAVRHGQDARATFLRNAG
jgi:hypothetical protein